MTPNRHMSAKVGVVVEIEHSQLREVVRSGDKTGGICDEANVLHFCRAHWDDTAQLGTQFRFGQQTIVNGQWLVRKFIHPVHVLALDEIISWIQEPTDSYCHVVIQKIRGLRYLQIDRCLLVLKFELQLSFKKKPIRQLPKENGIECSIKKRILTATRCKPGSAVTSQQKLCRSGKCFLH